MEALLIKVQSSSGCMKAFKGGKLLLNTTGEEPLTIKLRWQAATKNFFPFFFQGGVGGLVGCWVMMGLGWESEMGCRRVGVDKFTKMGF